MERHAVADEPQGADVTLGEVHGDVAGAPYDPAGPAFTVRADRS
jgi:hypothetical protein